MHVDFPIRIFWDIRRASRLGANHVEMRGYAVIITCKCGKKLKVRDEMAGKRAKCPTCGSIIPVPKPTPPDEELLVIEEEDAPPAKPVAKKSPMRSPKMPALPLEKEVDNEEEAPRAQSNQPRIWTHEGGAVVYLSKSEVSFPLLEIKHVPTAVEELKDERDIQDVVDDYRMVLPGEENPEPQVFSTADIQEVRKNERQFWVEVIVKQSGQTYRPFAYLKNNKQRDEVFEAFRELLGKSAKSQTVQHGRLGSIVLPLILLMVLPAPCVGLFFVDRIPEPEGIVVVERMPTRFARDALNLVYDTTGPIVFLGLAEFVGLCCGAWLIARFLNPALMTTLRRTRQRDDDDEE